MTDEEARAVEFQALCDQLHAAHVRDIRLQLQAASEILRERLGLDEGAVTRLLAERLAAGREEMIHDHHHSSHVESLHKLSRTLEKVAEGQNDHKAKERVREWAGTVKDAGEFIQTIERLTKQLEIDMANAQENVTKLLAKEQALKTQNEQLQTQLTSTQTELATAQANAITPELNAQVEAEVADAPAVP